MTTRPRIAILGAGPAGLGAAFQLTRRKLAQVTVLERADEVGGIAASFELAGLRVDYGSHRLHPGCDPRILADIRELLGDDLLDRPRHGRIRLRGRWVHFPLKPLDLALHLPPGFVLGVAGDTVGKVLRRRPTGNAENVETFTSVLEARLGHTICRDFYFPYARKLWGLDPEALSATQAYRRVSTGSLASMVRKVFSIVPGFKSPMAGRFYYPRSGFGQVCDALHEAASQAGARVHLGAPVLTVETVANRAHAVHFGKDGQTASLQADYVWSTMPITTLARTLSPAPPPECLQAAEGLEYRGMILIYLVLEQDQFTEYDAHYFPEAEIPISRLSEPKNYGNVRDPAGGTVLCAELPCVPGGPEWCQSDDELGQLARRSLEMAGIPVQTNVKQVVARRREYAYPVYRQGYKDLFDRLDRWIGEVDGLLTFGRQGLFAHDNTHHALYSGYAAADCLDESGSFDHKKWQSYRRLFETHVVQD